jgi:hypothetical protein
VRAIGVDAVVSLQEDSLPGYLGNSPDPISIGHWSTDEAARWVRDSNAVPVHYARRRRKKDVIDVL